MSATETVTLGCVVLDKAAWAELNPFRWPEFRGLKVHTVAAYDAIERLHRLEWALRHIADGASDAQQIAEKALKKEGLL